MKKVLQNIASALLVLFFSLNVFAEEGEGEAPALKAHYLPLEPAFVANFGTSQKKLKFVKAEVSLRVLGAQAINEVAQHNAMVRHEIVMLLSRQTEESMSSSQGQEAIRLEALEAVNAALSEETGQSLVEDLLFTTFVVQR